LSKSGWSLAESTATALDDADIQILKTYVRFLDHFLRLILDCVNQGQGPYASKLKKAENDISEIQKRINERLGWAMSFFD
jgi:26S proteasome regulatory subunit T1